MLFKRHATRLLQTQLSRERPPIYGGEFPSVHGTDPVYSPLSKSFDALVYDRLNHYHVPGLAVAVVQGGETFSRGYGIARYPDTVVTPDTIFYGASTTKAFVAAGLSLLIDESKDHSNVKWTTPISELIRDDFVLQDDFFTHHVTIEDAASHRTGLPRHDMSLKGGNQTIKDAVRSLRFLPPTKPLRTTFQYCNLMYITLGHVIETLTGQWLGNFLASRIWKPLNMTSTYFSLSSALDSGKPMARGQYWLRSAKKFIEVDYVDESSAEGAGGVLSSVIDYSKWVRMMIDRSWPISRAGHEALVTPHMIEGKDLLSGGLVMYGFGWKVMHYRGHELIFHNGAETGFGTNVLFIPAKKWGCIMMSNTHLTSNIVEEILTWHLIDELLDTPRSERVNRTEIYDRGLAALRQLDNTTLVREILYPPDKLANISTSLPLEKYAGTYSNPGYGLWHIQYKNNTLWNRMDRRPLLSWHARLEHLSSDRFLAIPYSDDSPEDPGYFEAEFMVNLEGKAEKLGLDLEYEMEGRKIWFDRVD